MPKKCLLMGKKFIWRFKIDFSKDNKYPEILILEMAADKPSDIAYLTSFY